MFVLFIFIAVGRKYFIKEGKETSEDLLLCKNLNFINTIKPVDRLFSKKYNIRTQFKFLFEFPLKECETSLEL